jgi:hypothetical protein
MATCPAELTAKAFAQPPGDAVEKGVQVFYGTKRDYERHLKREAKKAKKEQLQVSSFKELKGPDDTPLPLDTTCAMCPATTPLTPVETRTYDHVVRNFCPAHVAAGKSRIDEHPGERIVDLCRHCVEEGCKDPSLSRYITYREKWHLCYKHAHAYSVALFPASSAGGDEGMMKKGKLSLRGCDDTSSMRSCIRNDWSARECHAWGTFFWQQWQELQVNPAAGPGRVWYVQVRDSRPPLESWMRKTGALPAIFSDLSCPAPLLAADSRDQAAPKSSFGLVSTFRLDRIKVGICRHWIGGLSHIGNKDKPYIVVPLVRLLRACEFPYREFDDAQLQAFLQARTRLLQDRSTVEPQDLGAPQYIWTTTDGKHHLLGPLQMRRVFCELVHMHFRAHYDYTWMRVKMDAGKSFFVLGTQPPGGFHDLSRHFGVEKCIVAILSCNDPAQLPWKHVPLPFEVDAVEPTEWDEMTDCVR